MQCNFMTVSPYIDNSQVSRSWVSSRIRDIGCFEVTVSQETSPLPI
jgi:hypothetical protein